MSLGMIVLVVTVTLVNIIAAVICQTATRAFTQIYDNLKQTFKECQQHDEALIVEWKKIYGKPS